VPRRAGRRRRLGAAGFLLGLLAPHAVTAEAAGRELYLEGESVGFSGSLQLGAITDGFEGGNLLAGGERTFTHNEAAAGVRFGSFDLAVLNRYDYAATYHPDTAELYYASANGLPFRQVSYAVDLRLRHIQASGLRLRASRQLTDRIEISAGVTGLRAYQLLDGTLEGDLAMGPGSVPVGEAQLDYIYDSDLLFMRRVPEPRGWGGTLDAAIRWQVGARLFLEGEMEDLLSGIWWKDAPRTRATLDAGDAVFDERGVLIARPLLTGTNSTEDRKTSLLRRTRLRGELAVSEDWSASLQLDHAAGRGFVTVGSEHRITSSLRLGPAAELSTGALGGTLTAGRLKLHYLANAADPHEAEYIRAGISLSAAF
jgi:hypothetical protein